jgi:TolB-like protein/Flp pilus assembly protein TadD
MTLSPGTFLGPYEIVGPLGAGGMGEVYRASDVRLGRDVAIKVLPERFLQDRQALARFERETRALAALSHPNVLAIFDVGSSGPVGYAVTELLEGETLRIHIEQAPIPWRRAVEIAVAIADGLAAAHAKGLIHRDLKPENVYITSDGGVKILDFGLARFDVTAPAEATISGATAVGAVMGTPGYMSPEQIRGKLAGPSTDIFSLVCVLYEMIAGRPPFAGPSVAERIAATVTDEPPRIDGIPMELERSIAHCLEKRPNDRFDSARDVAFALKSAIGADARDSGTVIDSIAVLPFSTSTATPDAEYLSDGITESVINGLAQLTQLRVMARSTVYRHKGEDPLRVGRDLGVRTVLTGRLFQRGEALVVAAELVDVVRRTQIWGQQYRRQVADIFDIQEEISREISEKLRVKLTGEERERLGKRHTEDQEAYQAYLRGRYCWNQRTMDGMRKAVQHFRQAIDCDPGYALAYAGLGDALAMLGIYHGLKPDDSFPKAKVAAHRALEIDESLAEAHATLGFCAQYFDWDLIAAERELNEAIRTNAGYPSARQWYGMCLALSGRLDAAMRQWKTAQELDPFSASINTTAAWPYYWAHRTEDALVRLRAAVDLHPMYWTAHYFLGLAHAQKGEFDLAIAALETARDLSDSSWSWEGLGHTYALAGRKSAAEAVLQRLSDLSPRQYASPYGSAVIHAALGEREEAFKWLQAAVDDRSWRIAWLPVDPLLDTLPPDPRFQDVLANVKGTPHWPT